MCEIASGIDKLCDSQGGVARAYAWSTKETDTLTYANGTISALTLNSGKYAYPIEFELGTSTYTDTAIGERANSSYGREQSATIMVAGNNAALITNIEAIAKGRTTIAFELNDGTYEVLFMENGAKLIDERNVGTNYEDMNGHTLTFTGKEKTKACKITSNLVLALLEPGS
jgi:hypothetical protein